MGRYGCIRGDDPVLISKLGSVLEDWNDEKLSHLSLSDPILVQYIRINER